MRDQGRSALQKCFSVFTRCPRSVFFYLYGTYSGEQHGVTLLYSLRRLRHRLFTYLSYKTFCARFNEFCRAPFCLAVVYANYLYSQLFRNFICAVLLFFWVFILARHQRAQQNSSSAARTFAFFYVRGQRLYCCLCIAGKQSICGFPLIVHTLILWSGVPNEGPAPGRLVKTNVST